MKLFLKVLTLSSIILLLASCGKSRNNQMQHVQYVGANELANVQNGMAAIQVTSSYDVLALVGDKIPADFTIQFPAKYFASQSLLKITPVFVYEGGEQVGKTVTLQGDKVKDNYTVISNKLGGSYSTKMEFKYAKGVEKSHLELRSQAVYEDNVVNLPSVIVVEGTSLVQLLASTHGELSTKADNYQSVIRESTEGQIMYDYNSDYVKSSQLKSASVKELQSALQEIASDPRYTIITKKIIAYASPEGGVEHNAKLSDKRAASAQKAWKKVTNGLEANDVVVESVGQDWEGFQEAISASNLSDKELILRVLSMYSDPAVRENEIRNMSKVYTEINKNVFPELRRSRFITEIEYQNFTDEELKELANTAIDLLDEEAILRVAANSSDAARAEELYKVAYDKFASQRAAYNIAVLNLQAGKTAEAAKYLNVLDKSDVQVANALGVVELQNGNYAKATELFNKANSAEAKANLGTIAIMQGDYAKAAKLLADSEGHNKAIAYILTGDYAKASAAITCNCPRSNYLRAIIAARQGKASEVQAALDKTNDAFKAKAAKDIEFAKYL